MNLMPDMPAPLRRAPLRPAGPGSAARGRRRGTPCQRRPRGYGCMIRVRSYLSFQTVSQFGAAAGVQRAERRLLAAGHGGDFAVVQPLDEHEVQHQAVGLRQRIHRGADLRDARQGARVAARDIGAPGRGLAVLRQEIRFALPAAQAVDGGADAGACQPGGNLRFGGEGAGGGDEFQDRVLHHLFRFAGIMQDAKTDVEQPPVVCPVEFRDLLSCHFRLFCLYNAERTGLLQSGSIIFQKS